MDATKKESEEEIKKDMEFEAGFLFARRQTPCSMVRAYFIPMCAE